MAAGEAVGVALLGCGTVGTGVAQALSGKEDAFTRYVGCPLRLVGVLVRDLGKARPGLPPEVPLTDRAADLISSPEVAIVIEAMGANTLLSNTSKPPSAQGSTSLPRTRK